MIISSAGRQAKSVLALCRRQRRLLATKKPPAAPGRRAETISRARKGRTMFATVCILGGLFLAALPAYVHSALISLPPKARLLCEVWKIVEDVPDETVRLHPSVAEK